MPDDQKKPIFSLPADAAAAAKEAGIASSLSVDPEAWRAAAGGKLPADTVRAHKDPNIAFGSATTVQTLANIVQTDPATGKFVTSGVVAEKTEKFNSEKPVLVRHSNIYLDNPDSQLLFTEKGVRVPKPFQFEFAPGSEVALPAFRAKEELLSGERKGDVTVYCPQNGRCELDFKNVQEENERASVSIIGGVGNIIIGPNTKNLWVHHEKEGNADPNKPTLVTMPASMLTDPEKIHKQPFPDRHEEVILGDFFTTAVSVGHITRNVNLVLTTKDKGITATIPLKDENGMIADDKTIEQLQTEISAKAKALLEQAGKGVEAKPQLSR